MPVACVSGCVVRGEHVEECCGECGGCAPRMAGSGVLCDFCFQRLVGSVVDTPGVHRHLVQMGQAGVSSGVAGDVLARSVPGSRVLYPPALSAADEVAALLGSWADEVARLKPGVVPPSAIGWDYSLPARSVDPATGEAFIPVANRLRASNDAVAALVRWLLPHMAWVRAQEWAGDMLAELSREISTAKARWPVEERYHHVPMPCPYCQRRTLMYVPPAEFQDAALVMCENTDCGRMWVGDSWTRTVEIVLAMPSTVGVDDASG